MRTIDNLIEEYIKKYPDDIDIYSLEFYFMEETATEILQNAKGRKILLKNYYDSAVWKYEDEKEYHR